MLFTMERRIWLLSFISLMIFPSPSSRGVFVCSHKSTKARMEVSGVRISWLILARKSSFSRLSCWSIRFMLSSSKRWRSSSRLDSTICEVRTSTSDSRCS